MNIAVLGGAFNPIHNAHTGLAEKVLQNFDIDKVIFIPTFISPHKDTTKSVSFEDRCNMCLLACEDNSDFVVSDIESKIEGASYTYKTLLKLKEIYPDDKFFLIVGADMYLYFLKWKCPEKLFELAEIITCPRDEDDYNSLLEYYELLKEYGCKTHFLKEPIMVLSSTMVRENPELSFKKGYLKNNVYKYIKQHKLYEVK